MQIRPLEERLAIAAQPRPDDMAELAARGIRAIVSNRPDGEDPGQPPFAEIAAAARAAGLEAHHLPVTAPITDRDAAAFGALLETLPGPVLAFCRSGTRSGALWALSQAGRRPAGQIVAQAAAAGCDLSPLLPRLGGA